MSPDRTAWIGRSGSQIKLEYSFCQFYNRVTAIDQIINVVMNLYIFKIHSVTFLALSVFYASND